MFNVGAQLRRMRRQANFTLDQLASTSGVDRGTISRIELGHVSPRIDTISFLCEAMGANLAQFFGSPDAAGEEPLDEHAAGRPGPGAAAAADLAPSREPEGHAPNSVNGRAPADVEPDGYWPMTSHFWHGMLEVLDRFEALVKHSNELILVQDREGMILYASPASMAILGRRGPDLVGRQHRTLVHPGDQERLDGLFTALAPGAIARLEFRLRHKDGTWRWLAAKFSNQLDHPSVAALVYNALEIQTPTTP
jgi:PAS domain S-box-containing protein